MSEPTLNVIEELVETDTAVVAVELKSCALKAIESRETILAPGSDVKHLKRTA